VGRTGFRMKSLRLMKSELSIIDRACAALDLDRARLMCDASFFLFVSLRLCDSETRGG